MTRNFTTVFILCALLILSVTSFAQTEKGNMLLGGGIDLGSTTYKRDNFNDQKVFSLNINPGLSYFVTDNLAIGVALPFSISNQTQDGSPDSKYQSVAFGPNLRYYIPFDNWAVFPVISYTLGGGKLDASVFDSGSGGITLRKENFGTSNFKIGAGLTYFLNSSIAIESILQYNKSKTDYESDNFIDTETSSIGFDIGFQIYFQTKK